MELENSSLVSNVPHIVFVEWGNKLRIKKKKKKPTTFKCREFRGQQ